MMEVKLTPNGFTVPGIPPETAYSIPENCQPNMILAGIPVWWSRPRCERAAEQYEAAVQFGRLASCH